LIKTHGDIREIYQQYRNNVEVIIDQSFQQSITRTQHS